MGEYESLVLKYQNMKKEKADIDEILDVLKDISEHSNEERLMFEQALWYWKGDYPARAKRVCKQLINYFHDGEWVERAKAALEMLNNDEDFPTEMELYLEETEIQSNGTCILCDSPEDVKGSEVMKEPESQKGRKDDKGLDAEKKQDKPEDPENPEEPAIIREAFEGLVGMESVKKELISFYNIARLEKLREQKLGLSKNNSRAYNFVLYGNPGTGKTTVARIIGKVLYALGIRENDMFMEVDRSKLVSQYIGETAIKVQNTLKEIKGGTLFIDEAYSLYKKGDEKDFGQEAIDTLLKDMEDHRSDYSVILAGYRMPMMEMLNHANPGFRSRFTYHINIPDYSDEELLTIATNIAKDHHYNIEEKGYEALKKRIDKERIDETFGNARFIRTVIDEAEAHLANRLASMKNFSQDDLVTLRAEDIFPEENQGKGLDALLEELKNLIGLWDVKETVQTLLDTISVQKDMEELGISIGTGVGTLHMSFKGNAGTGKTTVARLLGKILGEMGVLKRGDVFVEVKREDLVGQYQGHTAAKVKDVVRSAMGGVLFIDEAYALVNGDGDSFGKEAVNALVAEMENHRDSLVVILAGYTSDIDRFLAENQGLRSRVTRDLFFEDYTLDEMVQMFRLQLKSNGFQMDDALDSDVAELLTREMQKTADFGNGRGVRNVFEKVKTKRARRISAAKRSGAILSKDDYITITEEDLR